MPAGLGQSSLSPASAAIHRHTDPQGFPLDVPGGCWVLPTNKELLIPDIETNRSFKAQATLRVVCSALPVGVGLGRITKVCGSLFSISAGNSCAFVVKGELLIRP